MFGRKGYQFTDRHLAEDRVLYGHCVKPIFPEFFHTVKRLLTVLEKLSEDIPEILMGIRFNGLYGKLFYGDG